MLGGPPNVGLELMTMRSRSELRPRVRRLTDRTTQDPLVFHFLLWLKWNLSSHVCGKNHPVDFCYE